jgi:hypothetical protein
MQVMNMERTPCLSDHWGIQQDNGYLSAVSESSGKFCQCGQFPHTFVHVAFNHISKLSILLDALRALAQDKYEPSKEHKDVALKCRI